ncbi:hypothetical protein XENTR_v10009418 [Xenopus tropicalis]|nr:hypothetical protein XENTR_v10009418 [Xenopus tropicalis]
MGDKALFSRLPASGTHHGLWFFSFWLICSLVLLCLSRDLFIELKMSASIIAASLHFTWLLLDLTNCSVESNQYLSASSIFVSVLRDLK